MLNVLDQTHFARIAILNHFPQDLHPALVRIVPEDPLFLIWLVGF